MKFYPLENEYFEKRELNDEQIWNKNGNWNRKSEK